MCYLPSFAKGNVTMLDLQTGTYVPSSARVPEQACNMNAALNSALNESERVVGGLKTPYPLGLGVLRLYP